MGEVENQKIEDIRLREKIVIVTSGKGNKRRAIPMSPGVARDLSDYYFNHRETMTTGKDYNEKTVLLCSINQVDDKESTYL
ncbi:MAG: hypothetical protein IPJ13_22925 [Saprospiraceae bacterium]|nr:hypothetical protein [Saprospiraceae bacterium]